MNDKCDLGIDCDALRDKEARRLSRAMGGNIESREIADGVYQHVAKETLMQWTTEFPSKPGLYWVRNLVYRRKGEDTRMEAPQVVEIDETRDIYFIGEDVPALRVYQALSAEWYGPIEPPE